LDWTLLQGAPSRSFLKRIVDLTPSIDGDTETPMRGIKPNLDAKKKGDNNHEKKKKSSQCNTGHIQGKPFARIESQAM
jgi:hypothetical protein